MVKKNRRPSHTASSRRSAERETPGVNAPLAERLRPWLLGVVVAILVARPLFPSEVGPEAADNLPLVMLSLVAATLWLLAVLRGRSWWLRVGVIDAVVVAWIGWHSFAAAWAVGHGAARAAVNSLWLWIGYGALYFLLRQLLASRRETRAVMVVLFALTVSIAGYGLEQYFYELPQTRAAYQADPEAALREQGFSTAPDSPDRRLFEDRLRSVEPIGTFALTNSLAGMIVPWLTLGVGLALAEAHERRRGRVLLAGAVCLVLLAGCLLLTKSRSGFAAALLGVPLSWWACRQATGRLSWKWLAAAAGTLVVLAGLALAVGGLDRQVASEATKSLGYRMQYWSSSLAMIKDGPLYGRGPGQFGEIYQGYKLPEASEEISDPHNFLIEVWVTAGTPALLALLTVLALFAWRWLRPAPPEGAGLPEQTPTGDATLAIMGGAVGGFLAALPLGLLGSAPPGLAVFWLGLPLACLVVLALAPWVREGTLPVRLPGVALVVLLIHLLAAGALEFAGVAGSFWLLLAVGLNLTEPRPTYQISRGVGVLLFLVTLGLTLAGYLTGYAPVLTRQMALRRAQEEPRRAVEFLQQARDADSWAVEPQRALAALAFGQATHEPTPQRRNEFLRAQEAVFVLTPWSSAVRAEAGERYVALFEQTHEPVWSQRAAEVYQQAIERYPNSALLRARLALALAAAGQPEAARREAQEALRLHELTPHRDKKLPETLVAELHQGPLRNSTGAQGPGG